MKNMNAISAAVLATLICGCTVSAITSVHETFPNETSLTQRCKAYSDGEFTKITAEMEAMQAAGWKVRLTGYDHTYFFGFLHATVWVCYEKPLAPTAPTSKSIGAAIAPSASAPASAATQ